MLDYTWFTTDERLAVPGFVSLGFIVGVELRPEIPTWLMASLLRAVRLVTFTPKPKHTSFSSNDQLRSTPRSTKMNSDGGFAAVDEVKLE